MQPLPLLGRIGPILPCVISRNAASLSQSRRHLDVHVTTTQVSGNSLSDQIDTMFSLFSDESNLAFLHETRQVFRKSFFLLLLQSLNFVTTTQYVSLLNLMIQA